MKLIKPQDTKLRRAIPDGELKASVKWRKRNRMKKKKANRKKETVSVLFHTEFLKNRETL